MPWEACIPSPYRTARVNCLLHCLFSQILVTLACIFTNQSRNRSAVRWCADIPQDRLRITDACAGATIEQPRQPAGNGGAPHGVAQQRDTAAETTSGSDSQTSEESDYDNADDFIDDSELYGDAANDEERDAPATGDMASGSPCHDCRNTCADAQPVKSISSAHSYPPVISGLQCIQQCCVEHTSQ